MDERRNVQDGALFVDDAEELGETSRDASSAPRGTPHDGKAEQAAEALAEIMRRMDLDARVSVREDGERIVLDRLDAIRDQHRLRHQARTKSASLHTLTRASAVQIDLVVTPILTQTCTARQISGFTASQLQRQWMFSGIKLQVPCDLTVQKRSRSHHLGVQQGTTSQQSMKITAVTVR